MVGRGSNEWETKRNVDTSIEGERLCGDQCLIVIHGEHRVIAFAPLQMKQRVGWMRAANRQTLCYKRSDGRGNDGPICHLHLRVD